VTNSHGDLLLDPRNTAARPVTLCQSCWRGNSIFKTRKFSERWEHEPACLRKRPSGKPKCLSTRVSALTCNSARDRLNPALRGESAAEEREHAVAGDVGEGEEFE